MRRRESPGKRDPRPDSEDVGDVFPDSQGKGDPRQGAVDVGHVFRAGDAHVARLATDQEGAVTRTQLIELGVRPGAIDHRLESGRLHRAHQGTYLVGHTATTEQARYVLATLACGPAAYISAGSALECYGAVEPTGGDVHVTVIAGRRRSRKGIRLHRTRLGDPRDFGTLGTLRITSPARAVLDYAEYATPAQLARAVNEVQVKKLATAGELREIVARSPGRHGAALLTATLDRHDGPVTFRSDGERLFLALLKRARLPLPEVNADVDGDEVDFLYRDARLAIELDGGAAHGVPAAVDRDRRKEARLRAQRVELLRYSWWQIEEEPEAVTAEIAGRLAAKRRA